MTERVPEKLSEKLPEEIRIERNTISWNMISLLGSVVFTSFLVGGAYVSGKSEREYLKKTQSSSKVQLERRIDRLELRNARRFREMNNKLNILLRRTK